MAETFSAEVRHFLEADVRIGKLAVVRKAGTPWVQPVWFAIDGDEIVFIISKNSLMGRAVQRDGRVALCVDDVEVPYAFAVVEGEIRTIPDDDEAIKWMTHLTKRYRDDVAHPEAHAAMLTREYGTILGRMTVDRVYFEPVVAPAPAQES
ncbi:MAG: TIGR03618 family F420-dependent PPOX class oxidoreductase [Actinomycetota bacterium]|nr:TIGR03618 family F420-dependent PPOX class oxidoreductase [Actinomycetota bacterium]